MTDTLSYKEIMGLISVALTFVGYGAYLWSIIKGPTRPHIFSWIIWGIVNGIVFAGQHVGGGGAGSWVAGATSVLCFVIVIMSATKGEKNITRTDWVAFIGAILAIPLWYFTKEPVNSVILATFINTMGGYPTIRKSWHKPYNENLLMWSIATLRSFLSMFALEHYSVLTMVFPVVVTITNGGGAIMLACRRRFLSKEYPKQA